MRSFMEQASTHCQAKPMHTCDNQEAMLRSVSLADGCEMLLHLSNAEYPADRDRVLQSASISFGEPAALLQKHWQ